MQVIEYADWDGSIPAAVANMPNSAYHAHQSISNSGLSLVARSPAHYRHAAARKPTRAMEVGTAIHTALLEPHRFAEEYITASVDDRRKVEYKDAAKVYGGDNTLTASEGASVAFMVEAIRANEDAAALLDADGWAELSLFVTDPETGVDMRCRFDWVTVDAIALDLKKTQDCREFAFAKSLHNYRYHAQAAMYSHVYELLTGRQLQSFKLLAVEEQPPCANVLYDIDPLAMQYGHMLYREALQQYAEAKAQDHWPTYTGSGVVTLPEYVLMAMENEAEEII